MEAPYGCRSRHYDRFLSTTCAFKGALLVALFLRRNARTHHMPAAHRTRMSHLWKFDLDRRFGRVHEIPLKGLRFDA